MELYRYVCQKTGTYDSDMGDVVPYIRDSVWLCNTKCVLKATQRHVELLSVETTQT